jgi:tRNA pseudouridine38/39 synthase
MTTAAGAEAEGITLVGAPARALHPVLIELGFADDVTEGRSSPCPAVAAAEVGNNHQDVAETQTTAAKGGGGGAAVVPAFVSSLHILHHLLVKGQISAEAVRNAHHEAREIATAATTADRLTSKHQTSHQLNKMDSPRCDQEEDANQPPGEGVEHNHRQMSRRHRRKIRNNRMVMASVRANAFVQQQQQQGDDSSDLSAFSLNFDRHVALHLYYNGEKYSGLAENVGKDDDNSIERCLFGALVRSCLVASRSECKYSRCGRTDRGVSAAGQIVALRLRSAFRSDMRLDLDASSSSASSEPIEFRMIRPDDFPGNSFEGLRVLCPARRNRKGTGGRDKGEGGGQQLTERVVTEHSYDKILNNLLPPDIRVLGWCPVSMDFSARFSASSRTYRYFFVKRRGMELGPMRTALSYLVGTHDFRNFCRMDVEKVYNFERTVYRAELVVSDEGSRRRQEDDGDGDGEGDTCHRPRVCWFEIHGQAFLWHQIRCIASVLFLIGRGMEEPEVVLEMLDVRKNPGKPSYPLADDVPLVLHSCTYENLTMGYSVPNLWNVVAQQEKLYDDALVSAARLRNCIDSLDDSRVLVSDVLTFVDEKLATRRRRQLKSGVKATDPASTSTSVGGTLDSLRHPFGDARYVTWKEALDWMLEAWDLAPGIFGAAAGDSTYVPLLQRHSGPTYEEKVANLQHNSKRHQRYEENVIKKRKTKEEDAAFYRHMAQQGSSNA